MDSGEPKRADLNKRIEQYIALRDRKKAIEAKHKELVKPYTVAMEAIENELLDHMNATGAASIATASGTAYQTTKLSATIRDGAAFRTWVVDNAQWGVVDWRANAKAVFEYIELQKHVPPGLNTSSYIAVYFRRPNEKE
jgi:hypothetical protein